MSDKRKRILITQNDQLTLTFVMEENKPVTIDAQHCDAKILGNIYLAKVQNIVKNINAAFIEIEPGRKCFLPLQNLNENQKLSIGDEVLVQIRKESTGGKEPEATCQLTLLGKHFLISYPDCRIGISHKLGKENKKILNEFCDSLDLKGMGLVLRTSAAECIGNPEQMQELSTEIDLLSSCMKSLIEKAPYSLVFTRLFQSDSSYFERINHIRTDELEAVITDDADIFNRLKDRYSEKKVIFDKIRLYEDTMLSLKKLYKLDSLLNEAISRKVWLKSGGFLIIDRTEAMTVIDVNSGKSSKSSSHGQTSIYMHINLEAALEISYQLRLRNISGIVLIDFINMESSENNTVLMETLTKLVKADPIQTDVIDMTALGLVEITRKKIDNNLYDQIKSTNITGW